MTLLLESIFKNILNNPNFFQKYDDEGYPIEYNNEEIEDESDDDDGFDDDELETDDEDE